MEGTGRRRAPRRCSALALRSAVRRKFTAVGHRRTARGWGKAGAGGMRLGSVGHCAGRDVQGILLQCLRCVSGDSAHRHRSAIAQKP
eukprot:7200680-Prymnesium_polylepis.2